MFKESSGGIGWLTALNRFTYVSYIFIIHHLAMNNVVMDFHEHALIFIGYDFSRVCKAVFTQNCYCVTLKTTDLKEKLFTFTDGIKLIIVFPKKQR